MHRFSSPSSLRWGGVLCVLSLVCGAASGCAVEESGINPPTKGFYFPVGIALDGDRGLLYAANSNADLRYNGGTLMALDLGALPVALSKVGAAVEAGTLSCTPDRIDSSRWECPVEQFIIPEAVLRIGNFPNGLALSSDQRRIFLPIRGEDPQDYLLWVDIADLPGGKVDLRCSSSCSGSEDCTAFDCDSGHKVSFSERLGESLPEQPFGVLLDQQQSGAHKGEDWLFVTHLAGGEVSFFRSTAAAGGPVILEDFRGGFFDTNDRAFALAASRPGQADEGPIYVSSSTSSILGSFVVRDGERIIATQRVAMRGASPGDDVRGIGFAPDGNTLYAISRRPASLSAIDLTVEDGQSRRVLKWVVEACNEPSVLQLTPKPGSADPNAQLAYVVCFGSGQIDVIDTELGRLVDSIPTGAGPNQLIIDAKRQRGFITNFIENTVGVIDLDPQSDSYNRMVLRIGKRRDLIES